VVNLGFGGKSKPKVRHDSGFGWGMDESINPNKRLAMVRVRQPLCETVPLSVLAKIILQTIQNAQVFGSEFRASFKKIFLVQILIMAITGSDA
jgi:hypothetical protein